MLRPPISIRLRYRIPCISTIPISLHRSFTSTTPSLAKPKSRPKDPYSATLNLPTTAFPLRADAKNRDKLWFRKTTDDLYAWQANQVDRPLWILHDGPPYANGHLHAGHALNKIIKDIINRSKLMQGYRINYIPGYDTHGLPLELKALQCLKKPVSELTPQEIRSAARKEALQGVELQTNEFKTFGVMADWEGRYETLQWEYEKRQLEVVREMVRKGLIVNHQRPTLYSPSSGTALAEAELEYKDDHTSRSVYVGFRIAELGELKRELEVQGIRQEDMHRIELAVWTTTAWTLPSNVAVAVSETMEYTLVQTTGGKLLVIATDRKEALQEILGERLSSLATFSGSNLLQTTYRDPLSSPNSPNHARPIFAASYVTSTTGTGLVHTAPAHGVEDYDAFRSYQLSESKTPSPVLCAVDADGKLIGSVLESMGVEDSIVASLEGKDVLDDGTDAIIKILVERDILLKEVKTIHKFPYDWRTKKPVIFRASSQWFANLEDVKDDAVKALEKVKFHPVRGQKTLENYVRGRSEWCVSRQRAWGVPLPIVYSYPASSADPIASSTPYLNPSNIDHIISVMDSRGSGTDYWWTGEAEEFVEPAELERSRKEGRKWRKGLDTMDVWFDSGTSWTLLRQLGLRSRDDAPWADLYLEGSDQHRGWFQSSLLTAVAADEGAGAPYANVLTHGMVLDEKGRKMSKSLGNVLSPATIIEGGKNQKLEPAYGVDLLRMWVASVDSTKDVLIGPSILSQVFETFRKIRNTARFMLGNLDSTSQPKGSINYEELGLIERYMLHELYEFDQIARESYDDFNFSRVYQALGTFSNNTLSSFYFDVIKDSLYSDLVASSHRQQIVFVLTKILETYTHVLAPVAPLLAEEINYFANGAIADPSEIEGDSGSVFQRIWKPANGEWRNAEVKKEMIDLLEVKDEVVALLEIARSQSLIGNSSEAMLTIIDPSNLVEKYVGLLPSLFLVSNVEFNTCSTGAKWSFDKQMASGLKLVISPSTNERCPRCRNYSVVPDHEETQTNKLCRRCEGTLEGKLMH